MKYIRKFGELTTEELIETPKENLVELLEQELISEGLLEPVPAQADHCQWCGGACGIVPHKFTDHGRNSMFTGWFSSECLWLVNCAIEAMEKDDS